MRRWPLVRSLVVVLALVGLAVGCSDDTSSEASSGTSSTVAVAPVTSAASAAKATSEVLAQYEPPEAPGYTMYLYRVTVPPGVELASHHHPGQQMARIDAGTLTYTVEQGTIEIGRQSNTPTESVTGPATVELHTGDSLFEPETDTHHAANLGDDDVVILISSLFTTGQPMSLATN
jgi:quercetin dioxygenase-like cupin family protein